jgi:signal transduction histidine kinase
VSVMASGHGPRIGERDIAVALVVTALMVIGTGVSLEDDFGFSLFRAGKPWLPRLNGLAVVIAGSLVLAFRRVAPLTVFAVAGAATIAYQAMGYRSMPLPLALVVALYTIAVLRRPMLALAAAGCYLLAFTVAAAVDWLRVSDDQYYTDLVSIIAAGMLGYGVALSRARASLAEQRATALAQEQEARTHAAVEQEQARIAREMHDIVAHDVSVMVAQAAAARRVCDSRPAQMVEALSSIEAVGRDALDGLRRLVGLLRTEAPDHERAPQPGLDGLPWLLDQVRRAGLPVELTVLGDPRLLPATVELNAYRIVQEALTNALKHGPRRGATVTLDYRDRSLRVEVQDRGGGATNARVPEVSPGYGLIGMQQRASLLGGELEAGPDTTHGFRVAVELPLVGSP